MDGGLNARPEFNFLGRLPASKSMLNRALLIQHYAPHLQIDGDSDCDDVRMMRAARSAFDRGEDLPVGSAGTVLRFMALAVSRRSGRYRLTGHKRLFARPQTELIKILNQLSVRAELGEDYLDIEGQGWRLQGDTLLVPSERSSQFATGVLLNAWDLPFDLYVARHVARSGQEVSAGYWKMSLQMAEAAGMRIDMWDRDFKVPRGQKIVGDKLHVETDLSSMFALAAIAAVNGRATFLEFPESSMQPDRVFVEILERMGVPVQRHGANLKVERAQRLNGVIANLGSAPDLFPVLAILAALAHGPSELNGAPHLVHKESNRLGKVAEWLTTLGRKIEVMSDGLKILGSDPIQPGLALTFDSDEDHRLAFAAAVLRHAGFPITLTNSQVVEKSFPQFWEITGGAP